MVLQLELVQHVDLQRPEAAAEGDLLRWLDALVAKHQHVVVQVRSVDGREVGIRQRRTEVQADHFGAERGAGESADIEG